MRRLLNIVGVLVARLGYMAGIRKKVTVENLSKAYPEFSSIDRKKIGRASYSNLGIVFAEMIYLRFASLVKIKQHITVSNPDLFHDALSKGKGLIVIAGHCANWEWLALGGALRLGKNFAVVRKNLPRSFIEKFLAKMRLRSGNSLIDAGDIRGMYRTLKNGGCIALLADQAAPGESVRVPFFGRDVPTFEGPARLALRTGAPMLFAECIREAGGDYSITFHSIHSDDLQNDSPENVKELTYRHTRLLEEIIRKHPDQWLWQHKRWKYA